MNSFNLLFEKWIPIRCDEGLKRVAPWELPDLPNKASLSISRPDFKAGVMEFLIGLVQTALNPAKEKLLSIRANQVTSEELKESFFLLKSNFNLFGDRPRFMQDLVLTEKECKERSPIDSLLIDNPGGNALKKNRDFFIKRGGIDTLCPACAAMALITLQNFAPASGRGHRTSLRGGGAMSVLRVGEGVWSTICNNILPSSSSNELVKEDMAKIFPWLESYEESNENPHPLQVYWTTPRRVVLLTEHTNTPCDICGQQTGTTCSSILTKFGGRAYAVKDAAKHPFSTYKKEISSKLSPTRMEYIKWHDVLFSDSENEIIPARTITDGEPNTSVYYYGYSTENAKILNFVEGVIPNTILHADKATVSKHTADAILMRDNLMKVLRVAVYGEKATSGYSALDNLAQEFFRKTEGSFIQCVQNRDTVGWNKNILEVAESLYLSLIEGEKFSSKKMAKQYIALRELHRCNSKIPINIDALKSEIKRRR